MAKDWRERPSRLLDIRDPYYAWCFDEVVHLFGRRCEAAMDEAASKVKSEKQKANARKVALDSILRAKPVPRSEADKREAEREAPKAAGSFRDPAALFNKK